MRRSLLVVFALFVACSSPPVAPQLPSVGAWQYIPEGSGEPAVQGPEWAWTGSRLFALGAANALNSESDATLLDPGTAVWTPSTAVGGLSPRRYGFSVWTGAEVFVWSGLTYRTDLADGGLYDPATDSWRPLPAAPILPRHLGTAVWTGAAVIVWGGMSLDSASNDVYFNDGAKFDPAGGAWSPLAISGAPSRRSWPSAAWTGTRMIVWGGEDANGQLGDGAAYDPIADAWTPISAGLFALALCAFLAAACLTCSGSNGGASGGSDLTGAWCGLQVRTAADCVANNDVSERVTVGVT
jgi:hypothetical protein